MVTSDEALFGKDPQRPLEDLLASWESTLSEYSERPTIVLGERLAEDRFPFARAYWAMVGEPRKVISGTNMDGSQTVSVGYSKGVFGPGGHWERLPEALGASLTATQGFDPHFGEFEVIGWQATLLPRWTDRGLVDLPGWLVRFTAFEPPLALLDVTTSPPVLLISAEQGHASHGHWLPDAFVSEDGMTVTVRFMGRDVPFSDYRDAHVAESSQVVAFDPIERLRPGGTEDYAVFRTISLHLDSPLGSRLLVSGRQRPEIVVREATRHQYPTWPKPATYLGL